MNENFTWGVATSAYQIEGGRFDDEKAPSIWDTFCEQRNLPASGDVACDHYHRFGQDIALMSELGVDAYRLSFAWTRIIDDTGAVNPAGLAFYDRLVDQLLAAGITPWVTLYHWDLPQRLEDAGGWPERSTAEAFDRYTDVVSRHFGDRVAHWITINEPWVMAMLGYKDGIFAPGRASFPEALAAAHHQLLAHGRAVRTIKKNVPGARVGIALDCRPCYPASPSAADRAAHRYFDGFRNRWFFDPVFGRGYPIDMLEAYTERGHLASTSPEWLLPGDLDVIATEVDFVGLNYYTSIAITAGPDEDEATGVPEGPNPPPGYTEMGWAITPEALHEHLRYLHETYAAASIVITENGASFGERPDQTGRVRDTRRIDYLDRHIEAVRLAIADGVPVHGYFLWSFLDNLEWTSGYSQRFGIVDVDHDSLVRTPKDSFYWYQARIRAPI